MKNSQWSRVLFTCFWLFFISTAASAEETGLSGLWRGLIDVTKVNQVSSGTQDTATPRNATRGFSLPVLLHSDGSTTHILSEVTVMKTRVDTGQVSSQVLITDQSLLVDYDGIVPRAQSLVGLRYSAPAFVLSTDSNNVPLTKLAGSGNVSPGSSFTASLSYAADHPLNPFKHHFHPELKAGFDVKRIVTFEFDEEAQDNNNNFDFGITRLTGTYTEQIIGLHKLPLFTEGRFVFSKVSDVTSLDGE